MSLPMTPPLGLLPRSLNPPLPEALPPLRRQKVAASDKSPTLNAPTASLVAISTPSILTAALAPKNQLKDGLYWSLEYMKKQGRMICKMRLVSLGKSRTYHPDCAKKIGCGVDYITVFISSYSLISIDVFNCRIDYITALWLNYYIMVNGPLLVLVLCGILA